MILTYKTRGLIKKKISISTTDNNVALLNRSDKNTAGYMIRTAITGGCSVVIYGNEIDYYRYIHDLDIRNIGTFDSSLLQEKYKIPFIEDTNSTTKEHVKGCFEDFVMDKRYEYLSRKKGQQLKDPSLYLSYFQIKSGNTSKEKVVTEALLTNIISSPIYKEPLHELMVFLEAPFKPVTSTMIDTLEEASKGKYISIMLLYDSMYFSTEKYGLLKNNEEIIIKTPKRAFEVVDEEIYKE